MTPWLLILLCSCSPLWQAEGVKGWGGLSTVPSESECRPYIEKALKELSPETPQEAVDTTGSEHIEPLSTSADEEGSIEETKEDTTNESIVDEPGDEANDEPAKSEETSELEGSSEINVGDSKPVEETSGNDVFIEGSEIEDTTNGNLEQDQEPVDETDNSYETAENIVTDADTANSKEELSSETPDEDTTEEQDYEPNEGALESIEETGNDSQENVPAVTNEDEVQEENTEKNISAEENINDSEKSIEQLEASEETSVAHEETTEESEEVTGGEVTDSLETAEELGAAESPEETKESVEELSETKTDEETTEASPEATEVSEDAKDTKDSVEEMENVTEEKSEEKVVISNEETADTSTEQTSDDTAEISTEETKNVSVEGTKESMEEVTDEPVEEMTEEPKESLEEDISSTAEVKEEPVEAQTTFIETHEKEVSSKANEISFLSEESQEPGGITEEAEAGEQKEADEVAQEPEPTDEDQLTLEFEIPKVRRPRDHIAEILHLTPESVETEILLAKTIDTTLKDLKKLYDNAIRPLEILFKYRDLSNRHFGDPEIFSKPLILFMGPWSGGKSTILNYLLDNEFKSTSLRTGAEPSPAYFNIVMWGEREEVLDGTQLAADWTFSGLQKFGQGLLDRLRGLRLNTPLLEKVNIVEIPGILEIRKQVERLFPFNDACQWFIDRADVIFLVYDPSKLDVGPETEAILDQLKGREYQTRIILNKADQVKPEELMRVQGTLIWNISPLMSSQEPPVMYSTSLWSIPYEQGSPSRLLHAQERAFLRDIRQAIDKRVENKIASARRFAVRVRNHAKMVDCYLTTYYNHKTFFGNRKKVADDIIEHPQNYHIYEGLSTLTNISRYDLPDPEVYRDFFRLNALYDFQRLSDTCTYFRGCPINRLDVAIAYDLPELVGKYKKQTEKLLEAAEKQSSKS